MGICWCPAIPPAVAHITLGEHARLTLASGRLEAEWRRMERGMATATMQTCELFNNRSSLNTGPESGLL